MRESKRSATKDLNKICGIQIASTTFVITTKKNYLRCGIAHSKLEKKKYTHNEKYYEFTCYIILFRGE